MEGVSQHLLTPQKTAAHVLTYRCSWSYPDRDLCTKLHHFINILIQITCWINPS